MAATKGVQRTANNANESPPAAAEQPYYDDEHSSRSAGPTAVTTLIGPHCLGSRVMVGGEKGGILRYFGPVLDREGIFCGIELERPEGKNDGEIQGQRYFTAAPFCGIFAPVYKVALLDLTGGQQQKKSNNNTLVRSAVVGRPPDKCGVDNVMHRSSPNTYSKSSLPSSDQSPSPSEESLIRVLPSSEPPHERRTSAADATDEAGFLRMPCASASASRLSRLGSEPMSASTDEDVGDGDLFNIQPPSAFNDSTLSLEEGPIQTATISDDNTTMKMDVEEDGDGEQSMRSSATYDKICGGSTVNVNSLISSGMLDALEQELGDDEELDTPTAPNGNGTSDTLMASYIGKASFERPISADTGYQDGTDSAEEQQRSPLVIDEKSTQGGGGGVKRRIPSEAEREEEDLRTAPSPPKEELKSPMNESYTVCKGRHTSTSLAPPTIGEEQSETTVVPAKRAAPKKPSSTSAEKPNNSSAQPRRKMAKADVESASSSPVSKKTKSKSPVVAVATRPPPAPKPKTKSQLIMEQLKQSMAAEKQKPKKEVKSKLAEILAAPPTPVEETPPPSADSTATTDAVLDGQEKKEHLRLVEEKTSKMALAASTSRLRLTTTDQRSNISRAATARFNSGRTTSRHLVGVALPPKRTAAASSRPRVSLLPPKVPSSRSNPSSAAGEGKQCSLSGHGSRRAVTPPDTKMAADEGDVVSASSGKPFAPVPPKDAVEVCARRTGAKEEESKMVLSLRQELSHSSRGFEAMAVLLLRLTKEVACLRRQLVCKSQQLQLLSLDHEQELVVLKNGLNELSLQNKASSSLYVQRLKDVEDRDKLEVEKLKNEIAEATANLRAMTTVYERCKSEAQLEHEKLKEALNALQREKNKLIDTLRKDESEKIKNLIQEVDSQKVAVELKSAEIHQLRQENTRLALQVDEFPAKEKENSTLKHKLAEVKAALDQSKKTEKLLRKEYEELNKSNQQSDRMTQSLIQENEELEYRLMVSSSRPASRDPVDGQQTSTPSPRNRHSVCIDSFAKSPNVMSNTLPLPRKHHAAGGAFTPSPSALRPTNGHAAAASYGEAESVMMRSSAVKLYQEVGRQRVSAENTADTIYTTAGEVIVNPGSSDEEGQVATRLSFDVEKNSNLEAVEQRREEVVHFRDGRSVTLPPGVIRDEVVPRSATADSGVGSLQSSVSGQLRFCKR